MESTAAGHEILHKLLENDVSGVQGKREKLKVEVEKLFDGIGAAEVFSCLMHDILTSTTKVTRMVGEVNWKTDDENFR